MIIYACRAVQHITDPLVSYSASLRMLLSRSATRGNGTDFFECSVFFCVFPWRFCSHVFDRINNFDPFLWILVSQASAVSKFHQAVPLAGQTMSWPAWDSLQEYWLLTVEYDQVLHNSQTSNIFTCILPSSPFNHGEIPIGCLHHHSQLVVELPTPKNMKVTGHHHPGFEDQILETARQFTWIPTLVG